MNKFLAFAVIIALLGLNACKKKEEPQQAQQPSAQQQQQPAKPGEFKPAQKKRRSEKVVALSLKIYQESELLKTVQQNEYPTLTTTKIKVGPKEFSAVPLKDLLAKNNLKSGKTVTLAGQAVSAQLTWEQANSGDLYVYMTPKKVLKIQGGRTLAGVKFPKRLDTITVSATEVAAKSPEKKTDTNQ